MILSVPNRARLCRTYKKGTAARRFADHSVTVPIMPHHDHADGSAKISIALRRLAPLAHLSGDLGKMLASKPRGAIAGF
jgi:hypothetical protein